MSCTVLLVDTLSGFRVETGLVFPSVWTAQMTGFLEQAGIDWEIVFAIFRGEGHIDIVQNNEIITGSFDQFIRDIHPSVIGFFPDPELVPQTLCIQQEIKKIVPDAFYCMGTISGTALSAEYVKHGFDYLCGQDVFASFTDLVTSIKHGHIPQKGVITKSINAKTLADFPFIAKKFFAHIKPQWCFPSGEILSFGIIIDSLGCTCSCDHCPNSAYWGTDWRAMSAERIFAEIKHQMEFLDVQTFLFGGINFLPHDAGSTNQGMPRADAIERLDKLDRLLHKHSLDVGYINLIRPDTIGYMETRYPETLKRYLARLKICFIGIESLSPRVLNGLQRRTTPQIIKETVTLLAHQGVTIVASFIVGSPWETWDTLEETRQFIEKELPANAIPILNIMTPYPGSQMYNDMVQQRTLLTKDLQRYNSRHLVFRHPVFKEGELEQWVQEFYFHYFTTCYSA